MMQCSLSLRDRCGCRGAEGNHAKVIRFAGQNLIRNQPSKRRFTMAGQPKAPFYFVMALVAAGLVALPPTAADIVAAQGQAAAASQDHRAGPRPERRIGRQRRAGDHGQGVQLQAGRAPAGDQGGIATTRMKDNTVHFALNVWAGWAPIILANNGMKAEKVWKTPEGEEFKVELEIIDNPVAMLGAYTSGDVQIGWGTLDMVPLVRRRHGRQDGPAQRAFRRHHAPHLPADRLVQRRRRHRGPRQYQDRGRPPRQEAWCWRRTRRRSISP